MHGALLVTQSFVATCVNEIVVSQRLLLVTQFLLGVSDVLYAEMESRVSRV